MRLTKLRIYQFRNYDDQTILFDDGIQYITGKNAQGKTNLLEAILYLSTTRSHRVNEDMELVKEGCDHFMIEGFVSKQNRNMELRAHVGKAGKNLFVYKNVMKKVSDFVGTCNAVMFCPDDLMLFQSTPRVRRRFIDMELSKMSKSYINTLSHANQLLKERNAALKADVINKSYIEVIDDQFIELQVVIMKQRMKFLDELISNCQTFYKELSQDDSILDYEYVASIEYQDDISLMKQNLIEKYKKNWNRDCMLKQTSSGFHKDDVLFTINQKDISSYASQGQKRSAVLALKLGIVYMIKQITQEYPILLLDDVFSELDKFRRKKLLEALPNDIQVFITATDRYQISDVTNKKINDWYVEKGIIRKGAEMYGYRSE